MRLPTAEPWRLLEQPRLTQAPQTLPCEAASTFGALALTGANVAVTENAAMELAASTISGTASFDSTDNAITDSGTLAITGATTIDAGTGNITLDETASTFGSLALTGANVAVTENDATELAASTVSGTFDITQGERSQTAER